MFTHALRKVAGFVNSLEFPSPFVCGNISWISRLSTRADALFFYFPSTPTLLFCPFTRFSECLQCSVQPDPDLSTQTIDEGHVSTVFHGKSTKCVYRTNSRVEKRLKVVPTSEHVSLYFTSETWMLTSTVNFCVSNSKSCSVLHRSSHRLLYVLVLKLKDGVRHFRSPY